MNRPTVKSAFILLFAMLLLFSACAAAEGPVRKLPIDLSGGKAPLRDHFDGWSYSDPTITVKCEKKKFEGVCNYWIARVRIADASQLRTVSAGGFDSIMVLDGFRMAKRVNAVLAVNGDYFNYTGNGYILRQGELYLDHPDGVHDVLQIDENGDFHMIARPVKGEVKETVDGKKVINSFFFGPVLVHEGVPQEIIPSEEMASELGKQRMCIAQTGPLEYLCIASAGPESGDSGLTLAQLAQLAAEEGALEAYNLDGGHSTMLLFDTKKINDAENPNTRQISDIIYFASAYGGK